MANSWSFLHEELNMSENFEDLYVSGLRGAESSDTISFTLPDDEVSFGAAQEVPMTFLGGGEDHISLNLEPEKQNINRRKYNEDAIIKELSEYITSTYNQHYSSDQIQTLDLIESCGDGEAFCRSNILKYASRYDRKGTARRDIMKIMHYAVLLMYFNDKNTTTETYNQ